MLRTFGAYTDVAGRFANANAGDPTRWDYVSDLGVTQRSATSRRISGGRVTSQLTPRNKVSGYVDYQKICEGSSYAKDADQCRTRGDDWIGVGGFGTWSPEATHSRDNSEHIMQFSYNSPVTNQLLLEAAYSQFFSNWGGQTPAGALDQAPFIPVQERSIAGGVPVPNMRTAASSPSTANPTPFSEGCTPGTNVIRGCADAVLAPIRRNASSSL